MAQQQQQPQSGGSVLTEYEEQLYDRSIRLWGLDAQKRLRTANILLVGFGGLSAEICKNLVLAGIRSVTIMDDHITTAEDLGCHLFLTEDSIGKNRAEASVERVQALNPLVYIRADTGDVESRPDSFFLQFALVCVSNKSLDTLAKLDQVCRSLGVYFISADSFGLYSYFFSDLHKFIYTKVEEAEHKEAEKSEKSEKGEKGEEPSTKRQRVDPSATTTSTTSTTTSSTTTTTTSTTADTNNTDKNNTNGSEEPTKKVTRVEVQFPTLTQALESSWKAGVARRGREGLPRLYVGLHVLYAVRAAKEAAAGGEVDGAKVWSEVAQKHGANTNLLPADYITSLTENVNLSLAPVCAIVGGVAAQEVIKILSANDAPLNNFFLYDSLEGSGVVERIPSA